MRATTIVLCGLTSVACAAVLSAQGTAAQTPPPASASQSAPADQGRGRAATAGPSNEQMRTVMALLDGFEINQADKVVGVSSDEFPAFIKQLRAIQDLRTKHQSQRNALVNQLRVAVNGNPQRNLAAGDDAAVDAATKKLDDFDRTAVQEMQAAFGAMDQILSVRERGRFRLFEERLEQQKLEIIMRVVK
jgi:hypothetical protein